MQLIRGQKIKLSDLTSSMQIELHIRMQGKATYDVSCFGLDLNGKLSDDRFFVFFNQLSSPDNCIKKLPSADGIDKFSINLQGLSPHVKRMIFTVAIESAGKMSDIIRADLTIVANGKEVAGLALTGADFAGEKAVMLGDLYFKDAWRFAAVGQGFNGGLSALLKHFGGEEVAAPPTLQSVAQPLPPQISSAEARRVSLEKKIAKGAPHLVNLTESLTVTLEKKKLFDIVARVALCLDASGSMCGQYERGDVQCIIDKVIPLAIHFDDDGELETWAFAQRAMKLTSVSMCNLKDYVMKDEGGWKKWMSKLNSAYNNEPVVMREILKLYRTSNIPAYVIFISDGGVGYDNEIEQILIDASRYPIFWQFVGIGGSNYGILERFDSMDGRFVDNCNFFSLDDIRSVSDKELYNRLLNEFPNWLMEARQKGILRG